MSPFDPQHASDYADRTTAAVKAVLLEIGQIPGSFRGKFAVIGGAVPWLLLDNFEMPHVGTLDVDLALDAEALGEGEYARLVESLMTKGYRQDKSLRKFQLVRRIDATDGGDPMDIVVLKDPWDGAHSKPLTGTEKRSCQIGGYRMLFLVLIKEKVVLFTDAAPRGQVYRNT